MGLFENFHGFDVQEERRNGEEIKLIKQVCKKLVKGKDVDLIASELEEDEAHIRSICEAANSFAPEYNPEKIYEALVHEKVLVKQ